MELIEYRELAYKYFFSHKNYFIFFSVAYLRSTIYIVSFFALTNGIRKDSLIRLSNESKKTCEKWLFYASDLCSRKKVSENFFRYFWHFFLRLQRLVNFYLRMVYCCTIKYFFRWVWELRHAFDMTVNLFVKTSF